MGNQRKRFRFAVAFTGAMTATTFLVIGLAIPAFDFLARLMGLWGKTVFTQPFLFWVMNAWWDFGMSLTHYGLSPNVATMVGMFAPPFCLTLLFFIISYNLP